MRGAQTLALALAGFRAVTHAVIGRAEEGTALDDGQGFVRLGGIVTLGPGSLFTEIMTDVVGACSPFPDIADEIEEAQRIGGIAAGRRRSGITIQRIVLNGKVTL